MTLAQFGRKHPAEILESPGESVQRCIPVGECHIGDPCTVQQVYTRSRESPVPDIVAQRHAGKKEE